MATFDMADLWQFVHSHPHGAWLIPVYSTCTGTGAAQNILDTYMFQDTGGYTIGPQLGAGNIIYRPAAASVLDRERTIGGNSSTFVDTATGKVYHGGTAYTNNPANGELYMITPIRPRIMFDTLANVTLRRVPVPIDIPTERFTNAAAASATGWSVSGAGSVTLVTSAANVQTGAGSLFFNAGTAGEYLKGTTFRIKPSESYFVTVNLRAAAGGPFYLALWDETNNVEIQSGNRNGSSIDEFTVLSRTFMTPTGCEEASVRVYCTASTDDAYIDYVNGPWSAGDKQIVLPTWVTRADQVKKVQTASYRQSIPSVTGAYDAYSRTFDTPLFGLGNRRRGRDYNIRINPAAANPARLEFTENVRIQGKEIWIEAERPMYDLVSPAFTAAGETSPTFPGTPEILGLSWIEDMAKWALARDKGDDDALAAMAGVVGTPGAPGELTMLVASYQDDLETAPTYRDLPIGGWRRL